MNEKVQLVEQKVSELKVAIADLLETKLSIRIHAWLDHFSKINSEDAKEIKKTLSSVGVKYRDELDPTFKDMSFRAELGLDFSLSFRYKLSLEYEKKRLEQELAEIEGKLFDIVRSEAEITTTL